MLFVTVIPLIKWSPFYVAARQRCHTVAPGPVRLNHDTGRALCHPAIGRQPASVLRDAPFAHLSNRAELQWLPPVIDGVSALVDL